MVGAFLVSSCLLLSCTQPVETHVNVIPEPAEMTLSPGVLKIDSATLFGESGQVHFVVDENASNLTRMVLFISLG